MSTQEVVTSPEKKRFDLSTRQWLGVILVLHLIAGLIYSITIPAWEAHDEWAHYTFAAYVAENHSLPAPDQNLNKIFPDDEASQPPLYYLLAAIPMLAVDTNDGYAPLVNRFKSDVTAEQGINLVIHQPDVEGFPWHGAILAMHLGRFVSVLISLFALFITFLILRYLVPDRPGIALVGTAIQAFAPQFLFLGSVITNDILAIATGSLLLYFMLRLIIEGPGLKLALLASLAAGLALLTKYVAVAIIPLLPIAFLWGTWRHRRRPGIGREFAISFFAVIVPALLLIGGLLWRNYAHTGHWIPRDVVPQKAFLSGLQGGGPPVDLAMVLPALKYGYLTYWASFGWGNLSPDNWYYLVWAGVILVGLVGMLLWLRTDSAKRSRQLAPFLLLFVLFAVGIPLIRELTYDRPFLRGRLLLATLPVAVWAITTGWAYLSGRFWQWTRWALLAWPAGVSFYLLFFLILPAYAPPPALAAPPELPIPINVRFGETVELLSAELWPAEEVHAGGGLAVTLAWRVIVPTNEPYALSIQLLGPGDETYGGIVSYTGYGNAATNVWESGKIFKETHWLTVKPDGPVPASGKIKVTLFNEKANPVLLPVYDNRGNPVGDHVTFGSLRINPADEMPPPEFDKPALATFGNTLALQSAHFATDPQQAGNAFPVWLEWQALAAGPDDLTLSVQLLDADDNGVIGNDGPVSEVLLPHHWHPGDVLNSVRWLTIPENTPPGNYRLVAILYHHGDLSRLQAVDADGQPVPDNIFTLGTVTVQ